MSGFHTGLGVSAAPCTTTSRRPATAVPLVPFTSTVSKSSRRTRTHQLLLNWHTVPSSSTKMAYALSSAVACVRLARLVLPLRSRSTLPYATSDLIGPNRLVITYCQWQNMSIISPPPSSLR